MTWEEYIFDFKMYLRLERSLSENTVAGYVADVELLRDVVNGREPEAKKRGRKAAEPEKKACFRYQTGASCNPGRYPEIHYIPVPKQSGQEEPVPQDQLAEDLLQIRGAAEKCHP